MPTAAPASVPPPAPDPSSLRPLRPLLAFGASVAVALGVGFVAVPWELAAVLVKRGGYFVLLGTFVLFLIALRRHCATRPRAADPLTRRQLAGLGVAVGLLATLAIGAEPFRGKILYDEFVLQSTAFNMHFYRDIATMVRGYDLFGTFLPTDSYLDKRPSFFPLLVSLVHDFTGYRPLNAHLLNAALYPLALVLAFLVGRRLAAWRGGLLALLLLGTLPLLGQNATGSGMELLNVVMLLAVALLAGDYLRVPGDAALNALLLGVVLLAQTRYESALYCAPAAAVVLLGWWRARRVRLPWGALLTPLLLVPVALQHRVLAHSPILWELNQGATSRFSLEFLPRNLAGAGAFLFHSGGDRANSLLLSLAGLSALALWLGWLVWRRPSLRAAGPDPLAFALFAAGALAGTGLVFCYYWSSFNDPMASRFALPLCLVLTFCLVAVAARLDARAPATPVLLAAALLFGAGVATSRFATHRYSHLGIDEVEWARRFVAGLPPDRRPLVITNRSTLPWLVEKIPSILLDRARLVADRLQHQLAQPDFTDIIVTQNLVPTTASGDHHLPADEDLPGFHLRLLAERRFGTKLVRLSRLESIDATALRDLPAAPAVRPNSAPPRTTP